MTRNNKRRCTQNSGSYIEMKFDLVSYIRVTLFLLVEKGMCLLSWSLIQDNCIAPSNLYYCTKQLEAICHQRVGFSIEFLKNMFYKELVPLTLVFGCSFWEMRK